MDFFNNYEIDFSDYFNLASPQLRGAVIGGVARWVAQGGPATIGVDWRYGVSSLATRTLTSIALGFPIQYLIEMSNISLLQSNAMIVTGAVIYFILPYFGWLEKGATAAFAKILSYTSILSSGK